MPDITLEENRDNIQTTQQHELNVKKMEMGVIGKIFGSGEGIAKNIAAIVAIALTLLIVVSFFVKTSLEADEIAKTMIPVLTLVIGFMFGRGEKA